MPGLPSPQEQSSTTTTSPTTKPLTFKQFIRRVNPRFVFYKHVKNLIQVLQRVADGDLTRVIISMPPRHGKSELVSRLFAAYYLYRHPDRWVGINSYGAELAYTLSRAARDYYTQNGGQLRDDAAAVKHWETGSGGGLWAAGVGGAILGKGFHLGIIDDPTKNAEEAASEIVRAGQREWFDSTFSTREEPGGAIILIQQRWNEDDLTGYMLEKESDDDADAVEGWYVVSMPAIAEETPPKIPASCQLHPDWRKPGEPLCPERYPLAKLKKLEARLGAYFWSALFQQRPMPKGGLMFQRGWFEIVDAAPAGAEAVRYWDKAGTAGGGAYTAGVRISEYRGIYYIEDVVRGQWGSTEREDTIYQTAQLDGQKVKVWVEQEPGSGGKESAEGTIRRLAGFVVEAERVTGSKETRAEPLASQAKAGNVKLVRGTWNKAFLDEVTSFPMGKRKDQVDGASGGFNKLATRPKWTPPPQSHSVATY